MDGVGVGCTDFHAEGKKKESTFSPEVEVAFNYGRRPPLRRYDRIPEKNFLIRDKFV